MKNTYTVLPSEIRKLKIARQIVCLEAQCRGEAVNLEASPVVWKNGSEELRNVRLELLAKWAALLPENAPVDVELREDCTTFFRQGGSSVCLADFRIERTEILANMKTRRYYAEPAEVAATLGATPVRIEAPADGGAFETKSPADEKELRKMKDALAAKRRENKVAKERAKAQHSYRVALKKQADDARAYREALATVAGTDRAELLEDAKLIRDGKRMVRRIEKSLFEFWMGRADLPEFEIFPAALNAKFQKKAGMKRTNRWNLACEVRKALEFGFTVAGEECAWPFKIIRFRVGEKGLYGEKLVLCDSEKLFGFRYARERVRTYQTKRDENLANIAKEKTTMETSLKLLTV